MQHSAGHMGVVSILNKPNMACHVDGVCVIVLGCRRFKVSSAWGSRRSQQSRGKAGGRPLRIARKWSLNVWIAHLVAFW